MKPGGQRARKAAHREAFHAARLAQARTPQEAALVVMSQVHADIAHLAGEARDEAWKTVTRHLTIARRQFNQFNQQSEENPGKSSGRK